MPFIDSTSLKYRWPRQSVTLILIIIFYGILDNNSVITKKDSKKKNISKNKLIHELNKSRKGNLIKFY